MRILVYEFASGGGLAGRNVGRVPASLAREGAAMRSALVEDLRAIGRHDVATADSATFDRALDDVDAVWLIAPETDRCLERLTVRVERRGKMVLGSSAAVVRRASDKARLPQLLRGLRIPHPRTRALRSGESPAHAARELGFPIVVKPSRGAGSHGVSLAGGARELRRAVLRAERANPSGPVILQEFVHGAAASVSLLADGQGAVALTLNAQTIGASFSYRGGRTPLDHPLASRALAAALNACRGLGGLRGFVGVDVILTRADVFVIEVNPRLTTAYLGVRAAVDENVAELALAACAGDLPPTPRVRRSIRFTSAGRIVSRRAAARSAA